jgi:hypothetical protein
MTKIVLLACSSINALCGLALMGAFLLRPAAGTPVIAFLTGLALCAQGTFTVAYLSSLLTRWHARATAALIAGEAAAILAGGLAVANGVLYNLHPRNGDFEFLPMSLGVLMVTQAALALLYAAGGGERAG